MPQLEGEEMGRCVTKPPRADGTASPKTAGYPGREWWPEERGQG